MTRRLLLIYFWAGLFPGLLAFRAFAQGDIYMEPEVTALAAAALVVSFLMFDHVLRGIWMRTARIHESLHAGFVMALPVSFFVSQISFAEKTGNVALAHGAERLLLTVGGVWICSLVVRGFLGKKASS